MSINNITGSIRLDNVSDQIQYFDGTSWNTMHSNGHYCSCDMCIDERENEKLREEFPQLAEVFEEYSILLSIYKGKAKK